MKSIKDLIEKIKTRIEAIPLADNYGNEALIQIGVDVVRLGNAIGLVLKKEYVKGLVEIAAVADGYDDLDATLKIAAKQFADLDAAELAQVIEAIKEQYDPADDALEVKVERVLDLFPKVYAKFSATKGLIKQIEVIIDNDANGFRWQSENLSEKVADVTREVWGWIDTITEARDALGDLFSKDVDIA